MEITVYENNRKDSPRIVDVEEVVERAQEKYDHLIPERSIKLALTDFVSFDPQSADYRRFSSLAMSRLIH